MEYIEKNSQTTIDVAIQQCGSLEAVYALALRNNVEITDDVQGVALLYDESDILEPSVVNALVVDNITIAGKVRDEQVAKGIGYWYIEQNFKVR
jgi:hypothetical protein